MQNPVRRCPRHLERLTVHFIGYMGRRDLVPNLEPIYSCERCDLVWTEQTLAMDHRRRHRRLGYAG